MYLIKPVFLCPSVFSLKNILADVLKTLYPFKIDSIAIALSWPNGKFLSK